MGAMPTQVEGRRGGAVGTKIDYRDGRWSVPDHPIIPFIEGDGTGPDIWRAASKVFDAAVSKTSGGKRSIVWREVLAGEKSFNQNGSWLPEDKLNIIIFRENIEDVYAGIEYKAHSAEADAVIEFLGRRFGAKIREGSAIGVKPMSKFGSQRLVSKAIQHAIRRRLPSVTLVHKGNIMKFTEGAFRDWGYEIAKERFGEHTVTEADGGKRKEDAGKIMIKDRIADSMFQQLLLRPDEYSVVASPNLNGDYLSDATAAQVGGLGLAPGGNVGDGYAVFEATHGTAPKYAGQDKINPSSVILSGVMMFEEMGWDEVAGAIVRGLERAIASKRVTYDLARQMPGATEVSTSAFADAIIEHLA